MIRIAHILGLVILCLAGTAASALLLAEHLSVTTGQGWFNAVCGESSEAGISNCQKVIQSGWGEMFGMPTAYWGTVYFLALTLWFLFIGRPAFEKRCWHVCPMTLTTLGAAASALFVVIMYTQLEHRCTWCLVAHLSNFMLGILTFLAWPRRGASAQVVAPTATAQTNAPPRARHAHPSVRLVLAVLLMTILMSVSIGQRVSAAAAWASTETLRAITKVMYQLYQDDAPKVPVRPDDPSKDAGDSVRPVTVVVFSDFECAHCRRFAHALDRDFNPLFDNRLRIVFKHYPLCSDCNPNVETRYHPDSCEAARAAEAARLQGGNDAFWKAHDILFELSRNDRLAETNPRLLAEQLGLDPDRFVADMDSDTVTQRIREDTKLGRSLGVESTPTIFVCDRRIPEVAANRIEFWQAIAHVYKTKQGKPQAPATQAAGNPRDSRKRAANADVARRTNPPSHPTTSGGGR